MELNKIYLGDSLDLLKELPDNSVDLVITTIFYNEIY
jgi:DNA modification methylase